MKSFKRLSALILAFTMLMSGCSDKGTKPIGYENNSDVAMGRYSETQFSTPEGMGYFYGFTKLPDNSLILLANKSNGRNVGPWFVYKSADNGKTWTNQNPPWLAKLDNTIILSAHFAKDGSAYFTYQVPPEGAFDPGLVYPKDYMTDYKLLYVNSRA